MRIIIVRRWLVLAVRGLGAILFGLSTTIAPLGSLAALVALFGVYALADGAAGLWLARSRFVSGARWRWSAGLGAASVAAGVVALVGATMGPAAFLWLVALWAIARGVTASAQFATARVKGRRSWLLLAKGVTALGFAAWLITDPGPGHLAAALWVGSYAVADGALQIAHAQRGRAAETEWQPMALLPVPYWLGNLRALLARWGWSRQERNEPATSPGFGP